MLLNKKVNVIVLTYNQEDIIAYTIESIIKQETSFNFDIIIGEDGSNDNTLNVVLNLQKKYTSKIRVISSENNCGMEANFIKCIQHLDAEFIAICDGDDYWIDSKKLQKQIDFLDENKDFGFVGTLCKYLNVATNKFTQDLIFKEKFKEYSFQEVLSQNPFTTSTVVYRKLLLDDFLIFFNKNKIQLKSFLDYTLWIYFSYKSKCAVFNDITTVYRLSPTNFSQNPEVKKRWEFQLYFYNQFKFYSSNLPNISKVTVNVATYNKAKQLYILALYNSDKKVLDEFQRAFVLQKDYIRYLLLKMSKTFSRFIIFAKNYEKLIIKINFKK
jgi:glycosyltransferase involved in cell wall biosynthesis